MMCFQDMTFCPFLECKNETCFRRLTDSVKLTAKNKNLAISQFTDKPECFKEG